MGMATPEHQQEVRFALVLYGGVSLAIYINGVMQEMLQLVRSTAVPADQLGGSAKVYRKLGATLGRIRPESDAINTDDKAPIKTKFKVDIISGTSAGGINGIFLAKALANGAADLAQIQELWFSEGDIEKLLNDSVSYSGIPVNQPGQAKSLLNSRRMYLKLLNAFDGMDRQSAVSGQEFADEIDLFATTTDIEGIPVPIQLLDNVVYERRFRNAFHFRFMKGNPGRNDFEKDNNPFLAFAARCTSSFPFAFEPMQLCNIDDILKATDYAKKDYCFSKSGRWKKFYTNYLHGVIESAQGKEFPQRPFGDGGYLNNAPFSYAVDALLQRQAAVPVDRKLLYVEPSPSHPEEEAAAKQVPNAIENSLDALVTIPGYQTIRNDLMRVLERNRQATKINKTLTEVENEVINDATRCVAPQKAEDLEEIWFQTERSFRAYYRMRAAEVTDEISLMLARIYSIEEDSAYFSALRSVVRAWREADYHVAETGDANRVFEYLRHFDLPYRIRRLRFVLRKLDSLYNLTLPEEHPSRGDAEKTVHFGLGRKDLKTLSPGDQQDLSKLRTSIFELYDRLMTLLRTLLEPPLPRDDDSPDIPPSPEELKEIRAVLPDPGKKEDLARVITLLSRILNAQAPSKKQPSAKDQPAQKDLLTTTPIERSIAEPANLETLCDLRAAQLVTQEGHLRQELADAGAKLKNLLGPVLEDVHRELVKALSSGGQIGKIAERFYHCFDLFDGIQYPMTFNTDIGEADVVQIVRVCPEDATALGPADVKERRAKLKGLMVAHFGAFLDKDWRVSDLLWGRLDAAERIITALLPWNDEHIVSMRNKLIDEAQNAILHDFGAQQRLLNMAARQVVHDGHQARVNDTNVKKILSAAAPLAGQNRMAHQEFMAVWGDTVPVEPSRSLLMRTLARGTEITGRILEGISQQKGVARKQAAWITNVGRALWGLVEISVPRTFWELIGKYWQSLLLLIAIILLIAGLISGQKGVAGVGWSLMGIAVALFFIRTLLGSWMRGRNPLGFVRGFLILVILGLTALGGYRLYQLSTCDWVRWLNSHGCKFIQPRCTPPGTVTRDVPPKQPGSALPTAR